MNLQRLLVERIEHRIIVGTVAFLVMLAIVGWIAINEGGRMQSFERQFKARSIERGAALFATNCTTCHGTDGLGISGRAPALNSPYLFGHDYLAVFDTELALLNLELNAEGTTGERIAEIEARVAELNTQRTAVITQVQSGIINIPGNYDPQDPERLSVVAWNSTLYNFINTTLIHGRPLSGLYWPTNEGMPYWGQIAGGPLRSDELGDLTEYILNWDKGDEWTLEDLFAVRQFPINPGSGGAAIENPVGTDVEAILAELPNYQGDPQAGMALYTGAVLACNSCHGNSVIAPLLDGTWTRVEEIRLADPQFEGYTAEQYVVESIVNPNAYTVSGYSPAMPPNFGERLDHQMLADILAYLRSQDQPIQ